MNNKVVLAFSGGLDTSFCVPYLKEKGYEVHTVMVNTGGFSAKEEKAIEERALALGATSHKNVNAVSFNFMVAVTICIDFGDQENKTCHHFHCFLIYTP